MIDVKDLKIIIDSKARRWKRVRQAKSEREEIISIVFGYGNRGEINIMNIRQI